MQKITPVILIVVLGLLLVNLIWTVSISQNLSETLEIVKESPTAKTEFASAAEELKNSKVVERFTFTARGYIKDIKDLTLTLEYGASTLKIPVDINNAQIVKQSERGVTPEIISFENLQVGDEVSCFVKIEKDGSWSAYRVSKY